MKFYLNTLFLICLSFFMISCSSMNDWDVSKIIDKTERWLFDDVEDNSDEKEVSIDEFSGKELTEEKVVVEEIFPDINDVPQIQPEFEEIDEDFFESESNGIQSSAMPCNGMHSNAMQSNTMQSKAKQSNGMQSNVM